MAMAALLTSFCLLRGPGIVLVPHLLASSQPELPVQQQAFGATYLKTTTSQSANQWNELSMAASHSEIPMSSSEHVSNRVKKAGFLYCNTPPQRPSELRI